MSVIHFDSYSMANVCRVMADNLGEEAARGSIHEWCVGFAKFSDENDASYRSYYNGRHGESSAYAADDILAAYRSMPKRSGDIRKACGDIALYRYNTGSATDSAWQERPEVVAFLADCMERLLFACRDALGKPALRVVT